MKKTLSFLLILVLLAGLLSVGAAAAGPKVVLSKQNLRADGVTIACEKYNIDGSNYFKLRDIACLVNETGSQFSVGWDGVKQVVSIVTGEEYVPNGSELDLSGGDKSATAKPSTQTILIDGQERSDLSVYNIGGNNYFKLRDLGDALGFKVDYDSATNSAIIISRKPIDSRDWYIEEEYYDSNAGEGGASHYVATYNEEGRILSTATYADSYRGETTFVYDELGRESERFIVTSWDGEDTINGYACMEYDIWGNLVCERYEDGGDVSREYLYTYDEYGRMTSYTYRSNYGTDTTVYTYDGNGNVIRTEATYDDGTTSVTEYVRDENGYTILERGYGSNGQVTYTEEYTRDEQGRTVKEIYTYGSGSSSIYTYTWDSKGRMIHSEVISESGTTVTDDTYDKGGRLVRSTTRSEDGNSVAVYQYDARGNMVRSEYTSESGYYSVTENTFDEKDRLVKAVHTEMGAVTETVYTYDEAERRMTTRGYTTYPAPESMSLSDSTAVVAVGGEYYLYPNYQPYTALYERVTWSSSDPSVAQVDEDGCVSGIAAGTAVITAVSESGLTATCRITVQERTMNLYLEPESATVKKGYVKTILCTVDPGEYSTYYINYRWTFDSDIVRLAWAESWNDYTSINLYVTGLAAGETTVELFLTSESSGDQVGETIYLPITVTD